MTEPVTDRTPTTTAAAAAVATAATAAASDDTAAPTIVIDHQQQSRQQHEQHQHHTEPEPRPPPPFAPIFTLVNNTSTRTTHHPHVRYIFSDDDPDLLTQALAQHHDATAAPGSRSDGSGSGSHHRNNNNYNASDNDNNRAVILDLATDDAGGYHVSWASSLSPSWAVLDAQLSRTSPPSSDGGNDNDGGPTGARGNNINNNSNENTAANPNTGGGNRAGRLMLRIEGVECGGGSGADSLSSGEGPASSGSRDRGPDAGAPDNYPALVDEFERRMVTLRKVVDAGEERRQKIGVETSGGVETAAGSQSQSQSRSQQSLRVPGDNAAK